MNSLATFSIIILASIVVAYPIFDREPNIYCMSKVESFNCHPSGTNITLLRPAQDERCKFNIGLHVSNSKRINATAPSKQCPCKQNYNGLKCDICSDGFHLKYQQRSPSTINLTSIPHISANYTKQFRLFTCESCNCDAFGSKSHICDKRNGTCFCVDGHTGSKCDKCALGYYNASLSLGQTIPVGPIQARPQRPNHRQCRECGPCFNQWHIAIMDIKEMSVDMIKKTFELSQSLTSNMGVQTFSSDSDSGEELITIITADNNNSPINASHTEPEGENKLGAKLVLNGNHDSFNELDEKISTIGERVLTNKHNSDKLKLLADELNSTITYFNETKQQLETQELSFSNLTAKIQDLNYVISLEKFELNELSKLINDRYSKEQVHIQEFMPRGAYRLLQGNKDRSKLSVDQSTWERNNYLNESSQIRTQLEMQLEKVRQSRRELDEVGGDYLNQLLNNTTIFELETDTFLPSLGSYLWPATVNKPFSAPFSWTREYFDNLEEKCDFSKLLIEETRISMTTYLNESKARGSELDFVLLNLTAATEVINQTGALVDKINTNITAILHNIASLNDSSSCDISEVLNQNIRKTQIFLDKIDARWSVAQSEMTDLLHMNSTSGVTEHLTQLSDEINKTLENYISKLNDLPKVMAELEDANKLGVKVKLLVNDTESLSSKTAKLVGLKQEAASIEEATKQMGSKVIEHTADLVSYIQAIKLDSIDSDLKTGSRDHERLVNFSNRLEAINHEIVLEKLNHRRKLIQRVDELGEVNNLNRNLLVELNNTFSDLSSCISAMEDLSVRETTGAKDEVSISNTNNSDVSSPSSDPIERRNGDRTKFLKEQRRVASLVSGYRSITRQLHKHLGQTEEMGEEFEHNREIFAKQEQIIGNLSAEMDRINLYIQERLEYYDSDECN